MGHQGSARLTALAPPLDICTHLEHATPDRYQASSIELVREEPASAQSDGTKASNRDGAASSSDPGTAILNGFIAARWVDTESVEVTDRVMP